MKRKVFAVALALVLALSSVLVFADSQIVVDVDGEVVEFADQIPVVEGGLVLLPIRPVFTALGFDVVWLEEEQAGLITTTEITIIVPVDGVSFTVNDTIVVPELPQHLLNERLMLPVEAIAFAAGVEYTIENGVVSFVTLAEEPAEEELVEDELSEEYVDEYDENEEELYGEEEADDEQYDTENNISEEDLAFALDMLVGTWVNTILGDSDVRVFNADGTATHGDYDLYWVLTDLFVNRVLNGLTATILFTTANDSYGVEAEVVLFDGSLIMNIEGEINMYGMQ